VITQQSIEAEFPKWETFPGVDRRWHARLRGADKPVMVHDDDLGGLREEVVRKVSEMENAAYRRGYRLVSVLTPDNDDDADDQHCQHEPDSRYQGVASSPSGFRVVERLARSLVPRGAYPREGAVTEQWPEGRAEVAGLTTTAIAGCAAGLRAAPRSGSTRRTIRARRA
jgi:hypothetical protein